MLFDTIPRDSLAATLTAADMISRMNSRPVITLDMRHVVAVVSRSITDPNASIEPAELTRCAKSGGLVLFGVKF